MRYLPVFLLTVLLGGAGVIAAPPARAAGCVSGAIVGGVAGHVAGHHGLLGAAAGCAVGHHMAVTRQRQNAAAARSSQATQTSGGNPNNVPQSQ